MWDLDESSCKGAVSKAYLKSDRTFRVCSSFRSSIASKIDSTTRSAVISFSPTSRRIKAASRSPTLVMDSGNQRRADRLLVQELDNELRLAAGELLDQRVDR